MADIKHIRIHVFPESSEARVASTPDQDMWNVYVRSAAQDGAANTEALQLIREALQVSGQIRIVSGHRTPRKTLSITTSN